MTECPNQPPRTAVPLSTPAKLVLLACLLSFAGKLLAAWLTRDSFFSRGNSFGPMNAIAQNLLAHGSFSIQEGIPSIDYEPVYPALLAGAHEVFGFGWFGVALLQSLISFLSTVVVYRIGSALAGRWAGAVAAVYFCFYPFLFLQAISVVDTTVFVLVELLLVLAFVTRRRFRHPVLFCSVVGGLSGLALLTRGSALALLAPLVIIASGARRFQDILVRWAVIAASALIIMSPWLVRNYRLCGSAVISVHGPFGLWQGNNPRTWDLLLHDVTLDEVYARNPPDIYRSYPIAPRMPHEALAVANAYKSEALAYVKTNPWMFVKLAFLKAYKLWTPIYNPCQPGLATIGSESARKVVYFASYLPLLLFIPLGLRGLWTRERGTAVLIVGILVSYTAMHMIAMGYSRLRLPLDPLLMILAGVAVAGLVARIGTAAPAHPNEAAPPAGRATRAPERTHAPDCSSP